MNRLQIEILNQEHTSELAFVQKFMSLCEINGFRIENNHTSTRSLAVEMRKSFDRFDGFNCVDSRIYLFSVTPTVG